MAVKKRTPGTITVKLVSQPPARSERTQSTKRVLWDLGVNPPRAGSESLECCSYEEQQCQPPARREAVKVVAHRPRLSAVNPPRAGKP